MVRVKWLESAKDDLREIYEYIALDSKRYARFQVEKIQKKTENLKSGILTGRKVAETEDASVREIFEGSYRIIYRIVSPSEIHILLVHHGARNLSDRL